MRITSTNSKPLQRTFSKPAASHGQVKSVHAQTQRKELPIALRANLHVITDLVKPSDILCLTEAENQLQATLSTLLGRLSLVQQESLSSSITSESFKRLPKAEKTIDRLPSDIQAIINNLKRQIAIGK